MTVKESYSHLSQDGSGEPGDDETMYLCICAGVTEKQWMAEVQASGGNWQEASMKCGAGQGCGGCRHLLAETACTSVLPILPHASEPEVALS